MLTTAIVLFTIAALFGVINLMAVLTNKRTSWPMVIIHGVAAAVALLLVVVATVQAPGSSPMTSIILFLAAAIGGFILFAIDGMKKPIPKWLALVQSCRCSSRARDAGRLRAGQPVNGSNPRAWLT